MFLALFLVLSLCRPGVSKCLGAPVMLLSLPTVIVAPPFSPARPATMSGQSGLFHSERLHSNVCFPICVCGVGSGWVCSIVCVNCLSMHSWGPLGHRLCRVCEVVTIHNLYNVLVGRLPMVSSRWLCALNIVMAGACVRHRAVK